jgi:hypothetical protein
VDTLLVFPLVKNKLHLLLSKEIAANFEIASDGLYWVLTKKMVIDNTDMLTFYDIHKE